MNEKKQRYPRFCQECKIVTYEWFHCGEKTRRVNTQTTIKERIELQKKEVEQ